MKKYRAYLALRAKGLVREEIPPCELCGDPISKVSAHGEDYSMPYRWEPPAQYLVCPTCHWWIHQRFQRPAGWTRFIAHVRHGGYGRGFAGASRAVEQGEFSCAPAVANQLEGKAFGETLVSRPEFQWWEDLTLDSASLTAFWARPRP